MTSGLTEEAIAACSELFAAEGHDVRRIIDLGCGLGVGTTLLAGAFGSATVLAVDGSRAMVERAEARAALAGMRTGRRHCSSTSTTIFRAWADATCFGQQWPSTMPRTRWRRSRALGHVLNAAACCACSSARDPASIRLGDELGRPGIWDRVAAARWAWFKSAGKSLPGAMNAEAYPSMIADAGLELVDERRLVSTVSAAQDAATHEFIARHLAGTVRDSIERRGASRRRGAAQARRYDAAVPEWPMGRCRGHIQPPAVHRQIGIGRLAGVGRIWLVPRAVQLGDLRSP